MRPEDLPRCEFDDLVGIRHIEIGPDRCVCLVDLRPQLHQPYGIVHGGVYATITESAASLGAAMWLATSGGGRAVGVSNHTDFLRSAREGQLRAEATPIQQGRMFQLWAVTVTDEDGRLCAHGKVRLANLPGVPQD